MLVALCLYGFLVYQNNHHVVKASPEKIKRSYDSAVGWLLANRKTVLQDRNPILWWMIKQSADNTSDDRLRSLFAEFQATATADELSSVWQEYFSPGRYWGANLPYSIYASYAGYQKYLLFSITCGRELADEPIIVRQNNTNFCYKYFLDSSCVTHQLMAYRFMQRYGCDRVDDLPKKISVLQNGIQRLLTWDPRVVDVYLQRVLMLIDSGAADKVKSVWLERILEAQLPDGSWSDRQSLESLGGQNYLSFGLSYYLLYTGPVRGTFHATVQGIWLMSLLQQEKNYTALSASSI